MYNNWRSGGTILRIEYELGWAIRVRLWLHVPPMLIEDCPLLWMVARSQTYYPEHILVYRSGKTCYSLVMGSDSFWTDCYG
jgi:hypothetical protein